MKRVNKEYIVHLNISLSETLTKELVDAVQNELLLGDNNFDLPFV